MKILRYTAQMIALMSLATPLLAQASSKPASPAGAQTPMIRSLSVHNPTPAYLIEASSNAYDAIHHGEDLLKLGHANDAVAEFQHALDYVPADGLAYQRLAEAYVSLGQLDQASKSFHKVLIEGFGPGVGSGVGGNADIWEEYALVLVKTHQPAEAVQMYNHGASLLDFEDSKDNGGKPSLRVLFPEVVMGDALPEQVPYTPEHLQALADAMLAYNQQGFWSYKDIKAHAQEAARLFPDSAPVQYYLGQALSGSRYAVLDSPAKDKAAAQAAYEEDKKGEVAAYRKAVELGDETTAAEAKKWLNVPR